MKDTIRNTVDEVYSSSISTLNNNSGYMNFKTPNTNNIINKVIEPSISLSEKSQSFVNNSDTISSKTTTSRVWILIPIFLFIILCAIGWIFRENITSFINQKKNEIFNKTLSPEETGDSDEEQNKESDKEIDEAQEETDKEYNEKDDDELVNKSKKDDDELVNKSKKDDDELVNKSKKESKVPEQNRSSKQVNESSLSQNYSSSEIVGEDGGFCYIGSDDNVRYCTQAYKGDICTSGDIYNRIDKCIVPSLRISS